MSATFARSRAARIDALFDAAVELPSAARPAWLARACDDPSLRAEVDALLSAHEHAGGILDRTTAAQSALRALVGSAAPPPPPQSVGAYRIGHELGRGGMGVVHLAERDDDLFQHRVAVKFLSGELRSAEAHERFDAERRILARLQHPGIARLLDGGVSGDGRPYYVMEYVDGLPIDAWCDTHRLGVRDRLALFLDVARAVDYAHRARVVHRDLKPSNILVTADGQVKLLDFGIAKLLDAAPGHATLTRTGLPVMTPEFAAPEQLVGSAVTEGTDVYALGLLLHELLTGRRAQRFDGLSLPALQRVILHAHPPAPSEVVLRDDGDPATDAGALAARRGTTPLRLSRALAGDLDRIVATAIRKEPERRYASAGALAEDVARHLRGAPVLARADSAAYRLGKFVRRHRVAVAGLAALLVFQVVYAVSMTAQERRVRVALGEAQRERGRAQATLGAMMDMFAVRPGERPAHALTVDELLRRAESRAAELAGYPQSQARTYELVGGARRQLGDREAAWRMFVLALEARKRADTMDHFELARTHLSLGQVVASDGDGSRALPYLREGLRLAREARPPHPALVASVLHAIGDVQRTSGHDAAADSAYRAAIAIRRALPPVPRIPLSESLRALALVRERAGDAREAESLLTEAYELRLRELGAGHPQLVGVAVPLASLQARRGAQDAARARYEEARAIRLRYYGEQDPLGRRIADSIAALAR